MNAFLKRMWQGLVSTFVLQQEEHRASLQALNIFFGAIIGVAFGRIEEMPMQDYISLLFITAAIVSVILIVSNTRRRLYSASVMVGTMAASWWMFVAEPMFVGVPTLLFPTLLVWAVMALLTEFSPRERVRESDGDVDN